MSFTDSAASTVGLLVKKMVTRVAL